MKIEEIEEDIKIKRFKEVENKSGEKKATGTGGDRKRGIVEKNVEKIKRSC